MGKLITNKKLFIEGTAFALTFAIFTSMVTGYKKQNTDVSKYISPSEFEYYEDDKGKTYVDSDSVKTAIRKNFFEENVILESVEYNSELIKEVLKRCNITVNDINENKSICSFVQQYIAELQKKYDRPLTIDEIYENIYKNYKNYENYISFKLKKDDSTYNMRIFTGHTLESIQQIYELNDDSMHFSKSLDIYNYSQTAFDHFIDTYKVNNYYLLTLNDLSLMVSCDYKINEDQIINCNFNHSNLECKLIIFNREDKLVDKKLSREEFEKFKNILYKAYKSKLTQEEFLEENKEELIGLMRDDYNNIIENSLGPSKILK